MDQSEKTRILRDHHLLSVAWIAMYLRDEMCQSHYR